LAKLAKRHRETGREGRHGAKVALQQNGKGTLYFTTTHLSEKFTFHVQEASNGKGSEI
jgi:hypothetical protein